MIWCLGNLWDKILALQRPLNHIRSPKSCMCNFLCYSSCIGCNMRLEYCMFFYFFTRTGRRELLYTRALSVLLLADHCGTIRARYILSRLSPLKKCGPRQRFTRGGAAGDPAVVSWARTPQLGLLRPRQHLRGVRTPRAAVPGLLLLLLTGQSDAAD